MTDALFQRIERWTILLALPMGLISIFGSPKSAMSGVIGGALMVANASALRYMAKKASRKRGAVLLLFPLKMFILMALVAVALRVLHLEPIPFLIGISTLPVAVVLAALLPARATSSAELRQPEFGLASTAGNANDERCIGE